MDYAMYSIMDRTDTTQLFPDRMVRYYNQFTNDLKSIKVQITILKTNQSGSVPLSGGGL
jgi:hypothetical protein